jgi:hypothetical protein
MLTRLGVSGAAGAFTIMRIAGHSSVTVSQRYVHPSPVSLEKAFERMDALNRARRGESEPTTKSATAGTETNRESAVRPFKVNKTGA